MKKRCTQCSRTFEAHPNSAGQVQCPYCGSMFIVRVEVQEPVVEHTIDVVPVVDDGIFPEKIEKMPEDEVEVEMPPQFADVVENTQPTEPTVEPTKPKRRKKKPKESDHESDV